MQIQLSPDGPPMWFLGEPKRLKLSLNYLEPGPAEVDFFALDESEQKKVLVSLRDGLIQSSDETFEDLYQRWLKSRPEEPQEQEMDPQEKLRLAIAKQAAARVAEREKALKEKEAKFQERCRYLSNQGVKALKSAINAEKDERIVRTLLKIEEQEKQRTMIVRHLHEKLRKIEKKRAEEIEKATQRQIKANPQIRKTSPMTVVESEMETVTLTPEDLIEAVAASPGGE